MTKGRVAVFPGSFDPPTRGHLDIVQRAAGLFDRLVLGVLVNSAKTPLLDTETRVKLLEEEIRDLGLDNVQVGSFAGLTVEFASSVGAGWVVRGVRGNADLSWESSMALTNRLIAGADIDTLFLPASPELSFVQGQLVREIARAGGELRELVTPRVEKTLKGRP